MPPNQNYEPVATWNDAHDDNVRIDITRHIHKRSRFGARIYRVFEKGGIQHRTNHFRTSDTPAIVRLATKFSEKYSDPASGSA